jgi:hypothetical protein
MAEVRLNRDVKNLPQCCIVCAATTTLQESTTFELVSPALRIVLWVIGGWLFGAVFEAFSDRATLLLPYCARHGRDGVPEDQKRARTLRWIGVVIGVCVAIAGFFSMRSQFAPILPTVLIGAGAAVIIVSLVLKSAGQRERRRVSVTKISDGSITLTGVSDAFREALATHEEDPALKDFLRGLA